MDALTNLKNKQLELTVLLINKKYFIKAIAFYSRFYFVTKWMDALTNLKNQENKQLELTVLLKKQIKYFIKKHFRTRQLGGVFKILELSE